VGTYREIELEIPLLFLSRATRRGRVQPRERNEKEGKPARGRGMPRKKGVEPRHTSAFPGGKGNAKTVVGGEGTRMASGRRHARRIGTTMTMITVGKDGMATPLRPLIRIRYEGRALHRKKKRG